MAGGVFTFPAGEDLLLLEILPELPLTKRDRPDQSN